MTNRVARQRDSLWVRLARFAVKCKQARHNEIGTQMNTPLDPNQPFDGPSEFSWGKGMFPPGIAENEGQRRMQQDFGDNMIPTTNRVGSHNDNYARAVADRRTDPTDPESQRDFETLGNPDRFGAAPPLIRELPQPNISQRVDPPPNERVQRKW